MRWVIGGSIVIVAMIWPCSTFFPIQGAQRSRIKTCCGRVRGGIRIFVRDRGGAHQRVAGQFLKSDQRHEHRTLMATCAIFFLAGWTSPKYAVLALMIGGAVCIASAIAGATSQDLKTGYLVGATPFWQQMGFWLASRSQRWLSGRR